VRLLGADDGVSFWFAKAVVAFAVAGMFAVRAPHVRRSLAIKVATSREGALDKALVGFVLLSLILSIVWLVAPIQLLEFAGYPLAPAPLACGALCFALGLWLLHRSHVDLGASWSNTLELREQHQLVTSGVYHSLRHPMYTALLLYSVGQALALPNWLARPSCLVAFALLVALRLGPEERMMREAFGAKYEAYATRTKRLVPGLW
jgi:protein-S-isoprenylcysteine O-methyltransferase Ste14